MSIVSRVVAADISHVQVFQKFAFTMESLNYVSNDEFAEQVAAAHAHEVLEV